MNEITKLYKNARIEPDCIYLFLVDGNGENEAARTISIGSKADLKRLIVDCGVKGRVIKSTNTLKPFYPPFTAEKQIELIKWIFKSDYYITYSFWGNKYGYNVQYEDKDELIEDENFENSLAKVINFIWNFITEEEKQQVKGILE